MYNVADQSIARGGAEDEKMTIQEVLDRCLDEIHSGRATVEDCLAEYPQYARELAPLLRTAARLEATAGVRPTRAFKSRLRKQLPGQSTKPRAGLDSLGAFILWSLIVIILVAFAVWMGIEFEVSGHPNPPLPINFWHTPSQILYGVDPPPFQGNRVSCIG